MNMSDESRIEELAHEKMGGKSYSTIREELLASGMSEEKAKALIRLVYSPFIAGILVMLYGRFLQRKQSSPAGSGTGAIRRKRPYK